MTTTTPITDGQLAVFVLILRKMNNKIGLKEFVQTHSMISQRSLENYAWRGMKPANKKFYYVLNALKNDYPTQYKAILDEIVEDHGGDLSIRDIIIKHDFERLKQETVNPF